MTEILLVCEADGSFKSIKALGHAGFASKGSDIVCAAETILLRTALNLLEQTEGVLVQKDASVRGTLAFSVKQATFQSNERLKCIADFLRTGLSGLSKEYPLNITLREITENNDR